MTTTNRVLYRICLTCIAALTLLLLVAIWMKIGSEVVWKMIGSTAVAMFASAFALAVNLHRQKMEAIERDMDRIQQRASSVEEPRTQSGDP